MTPEERIAEAETKLLDTALDFFLLFDNPHTKEDALRTFLNGREAARAFLDACQTTDNISTTIEQAFQAETQEQARESR